jgi:hypothetical protein
VRTELKSSQNKAGVLPKEWNQDWDWGVLSPEEIDRLEGILRSVFAHLIELRKKDGLASHIQNPKIPPIMSESAIINIRSKLFPGSIRARRGGDQGDILLEFPDGKQRRVEVKATGEQGYQKFSNKDVTADFLVWIHFGTSLQNGEGGVVMHLVERPGSFLSMPQGKSALDIWIEKFLKLAPKDRRIEYSGASLTEIIRNLS